MKRRQLTSLIFLLLRWSGNTAPTILGLFRRYSSMDACRDRDGSTGSDHLRCAEQNPPSRPILENLRQPTPCVSLIGMSVLNLWEKVKRSLGLTFPLDPPFEGVLRAHAAVSDDGLDLELDRSGCVLLLPPDDPAPLHTVAYRLPCHVLSRAKTTPASSLPNYVRNSQAKVKQYNAQENAP